MGWGLHPPPATDPKPSSTVRQPQGDVLSSCPVLCPGGDQSTHNFETRNQCTDEGILRGDPPFQYTRCLGTEGGTGQPQDTALWTEKGRLFCALYEYSGVAWLLGETPGARATNRQVPFYLRNLKIQKKGWFLFDKLLGAQ